MSESFTVRPAGPLRGELSVPGDKSISHRSVMLAALAEGESRVRNLLRGEDVLHTCAAFRAMGIEIEDLSGGVTVQGRGLAGLRPPAGPLDMGNSGTGMRLLAGILAGQPFSATLTGDASLSSRPMGRIIEPLERMGAAIEATAKKTAPLKITGGRLRPIRYALPVASAQVKSAVLLAGLFAEGVTETVENAPSRDHTERMLRGMGAAVEVQGGSVKLTGRPRLRPLDLEVPGDISSAAFFLVAALIVPGSELLIKGVGMNPTRTGVLDILAAMGADITRENAREVAGEPAADLRVRASALHGVTVSGGLVPRAIDEFPILCVAAAHARGSTEFREASELRVKESDRIATMAKELGRMGARITEREDGLVIEGGARLRGAAGESHGDHRVAMSLAVAGLAAQGETHVADTGCVATSFPDFILYLQRLDK